jgi:hypothetical protein
MSWTVPLSECELVPGTLNHLKLDAPCFSGLSTMLLFRNDGMTIVAGLGRTSPLFCVGFVGCASRPTLNNSELGREKVAGLWACIPSQRTAIWSFKELVEGRYSRIPEFTSSLEVNHMSSSAMKDITRC